MTKTEIEVIENVIKRLRCEPRPNGQPRGDDAVRAAFLGDARIYIDTWIIPALELILPGDERNPSLALRISK